MFCVLCNPDLHYLLLREAPKCAAIRYWRQVGAVSVEAQSSTAPYGLTFRPTSCALWYEPIEYVKETVAFKEYERQLEDEANQDAGYAQEVADLEQMEEEDDLPMP